jgi:hypothetical protein
VRWQPTSSARPARKPLLYAHRLGLALQLTNIIRDVGEDAMRGRIYLPVNELQQFNVKAHELLQRQDSGDFPQRFLSLMRFQAERAHRCYDEALALLPAQDRRAQKPGLMMGSIYRDLLREIERDDFQVLRQRVSLTPLRKLWLAWRVQALGPPVRPAPARLAVIGGGWAGMAAAVRAIERGQVVTVFEAARGLGGRARALGRPPAGRARGPASTTASIC